MVVTHAWSKQPIPYAVEVPDRAPKERYYSQEFFDLEAEQTVVADLADGLSSRRDPRTRRLQRL